MKKERRRHGRTHPSKGLEVRCTVAEHAGREEERYNLACRIVDVSAKGACLVTVGRLRKGVPVAIDLFVPHGVHFRSKATVQWSATLESRGREAHVAGLHFDRVFRTEGPKKEAPARSDSRPGRTAQLHTPEPVRAHKRFSPEEVNLVCLPKGLLRTLGLATNTGRRLKDLSRGGAQIVCSRRLKPGERVDLRLEFGRPELNIEAEGVVRWCQRDTASLEPRYLAGVVFKNLPEGSERSLRAIERAFIGF
jgi:hypothetical protein